MSDFQQTAILVGAAELATVGDIIIDVVILEPSTFSNRVALNPVAKRFTGHIEKKASVDSIVATWFDVRHNEGEVRTGYAAEQAAKVEAIAATVVTISTPSEIFADVIITDITKIPTPNYPGKATIRIKFIDARIAGISTREILPSELSKYAANRAAKAAKRKAAKAATEEEGDKSKSIFDGSVPLNIAKNAGWID